ncbi:MAG: hypothetical protein A1D16_14885 [Flavihumibacter sp. CACIAM 22H1]|nr:MAG: hypothetical protein A1D16_14885 [Flavihumibacter sp. CACIAM 22H1]
MRGSYYSIGVWCVGLPVFYSPLTSLYNDLLIKNCIYKQVPGPLWFPQWSRKNRGGIALFRLNKPGGPNLLQYGMIPTLLHGFIEQLAAYL